MKKYKCPLDWLEVPVSEKSETAAFLSFMDKVPLSRFHSLTPKQLQEAESRIVKQILYNFMIKLLKTKKPNSFM